MHSIILAKFSILAKIPFVDINLSYTYGKNLIQVTLCVVTIESAWHSLKV